MVHVEDHTNIKTTMYLLFWLLQTLFKDASFFIISQQSFSSDSPPTLNKLIA